MSNSPSPLFVSHHDEQTGRESSASMPHGNDDKQSIETVLSESKRLIKSGFYKKAYNIIENYKNETNATIPPVPHIKLCRRMVICLTRICDRYLTKGEIQRVDHFIKLMNKSYDYLQTWHELLTTYICKTNPKFAHLQKVLDEVSENYEDAFDMNFLRISKRGSGLGLQAVVNNNNHTSANNNSSYINSSETRDATKPSSFLNKFRRGTLNPKGKQVTYMEDYSNLEVSRMNTDNITGQELNGIGLGISCSNILKKGNFHLDEFLKYYLNIMLNWATFFKKVHKKYDAAFKILSFCYKVTKSIDVCFDPDLLHTVAECRMALGTFYSEFGKHQDAAVIFESTINVLQTEISLRLNGQKSQNSFSVVYKFKATIRLLILLFINLGLVHEQNDGYAKTLESLRLGFWFANKFMAPEDEIYQMVVSQYNNAVQKYDRYLKELGEIERVVGNKKDNDTEGDAKETVGNDHFAKLNQHIYTKFNYDKLNASQFIVMTSPDNTFQNRRGSSHRNNRSDFMGDDKMDFTTDSKQGGWSRLRDLQQTDGSFGRMGLESNESPNTMLSWKRNSVGGKSTAQIKKKSKSKKPGQFADEYKPLTDDLYRKEMNWEKETEKVEYDSEEEREYINKLNKNIKDSSKKSKSKNKKATDNKYLDLDHYFEKLVEQKVHDEEEEMHVQPVGFKKIVKNYAHFLKNESFDDREFSFAAKSLTARARENLGEYSAITKYKAPANKLAELNNVKIEAQLLDAKNEAETRVAARHASLKSFILNKAAQAKTVKFAPQIETQSPTLAKPASLPQIDEVQSSSKTSKHSFSSILLKHKDNLGLNAVHNMKKEIEKHEQKRQEHKQQKEDLKLFKTIKAPVKPNSNNSTPMSKGTMRSPKGKEYDPERMKKFAETTKNTIQLLMEQMEKNMAEDDNIRQRIADSKPLVEVELANSRFLKVSDDLAKSTKNISIKAEAGKKVWNFSQLVKGVSALTKKGLGGGKTPKAGM